MQGKRWVLVMVLVLGAAALAWAAETMSVQVKEGRVYAKPSFLSKLQATLPYGAQLQVEGEQGAWRQVGLSGGLQGWIHVSALTEKQVSLQAGRERAASGASSEEMSLAGKGFNKQVENSYRSSNQGLNYAAVDNMERGYPVTPEQVDKFVQAGGLHVTEGGGQ